MTDKKNDKPEKVPGHKHPDGRGGGSLTPVRTSEQGKALAEKRWGHCAMRPIGAWSALWLP